MEFISLEQGAQKVLRLTHLMLESAEQGDWDLLRNLETERSRSLDCLFQHPEMPLGLSTIANALQQVMELDRRCIALGEAARSDMAKELHQQVQGQQAVRSYLDHQR